MSLIKKSLKFSLICLVICFLISALPLTIQAANCANQTGSGSCLENPLGSTEITPADLYGRLIYGFMGITGTLALVMFMVGGSQWMTAAGNPEKVKKGKDTLLWAVLGLVVIFSSYAILRAVLETLQF